MKLCWRYCIPICDACKYAKREEYFEYSVPIGCEFSEDEEHQETARHDYYCNDFECSHYNNGPEPIEVSFEDYSIEEFYEDFYGVGAE